MVALCWLCGLPHLEVANGAMVPELFQGESHWELAGWDPQDWAKCHEILAFLVSSIVLTGLC